MMEKYFKKETDIMYGAILGDIIGSPYEFDMGDKTKDFPCFLHAPNLQMTRL